MSQLDGTWDGRLDCVLCAPVQLLSFLCLSLTRVEGTLYLFYISSSKKETTILL